MESASKKNLSCLRWQICGLLVSSISAFFLISYDIVELIIQERIKMRPNLPFYEFWREPPVPVKITTYLFAVTNHKEFSEGLDSKLKIEEVGPIVYKRYIKQKDIVFDVNSTLSYTTEYENVFDEESSAPGILNKTIIIPSPVALTVASIINSKIDNYIIRKFYSMLLENLRDFTFLNRTVYDCLWNLNTPVLNTVTFASKWFIPRTNGGMLFNALFPSKHRYNVNIGPSHGTENFFKINTLNNQENIPHQHEKKDQCPFSLQGAFEGTSFSPKISKTTVINTYHPNICRTYPIVFKQETKCENLNCYEFEMQDDFYRIHNNSKDCFRMANNVNVPDGLVDFSKCTYGVPIAVSQPHFLGFEGPWTDNIDGLKPDAEKHLSKYLIEPVFGVPIDLTARIQSNMIMPKISKSLDIHLDKFSEMIVPMFWVEVRFHLDDPLILSSLKVIVDILPVLVPIIVVVLFLTAISSAVCIRKKLESHKKYIYTLEQERKSGMP